MVGLSFLLTLVAGLWPDGLVLTLTPVNRGGPMLVFPLEPGERFTLFYFHSVNHLPIWEEHSVDGQGRIYIEEERFLSLNAGMGHWQGHGRHVLRERIPGDRRHSQAPGIICLEGWKPRGGSHDPMAGDQNQSFEHGSGPGPFGPGREVLAPGKALAPTSWATPNDATEP